MLIKKVAYDAANETLKLSFKRYFTDFFHLPKIAGKARGTEQKSKTQEE